MNERRRGVKRNTHNDKMIEKRKRNRHKTKQRQIHRPRQKYIERRRRKERKRIKGIVCVCV